MELVSQNSPFQWVRQISDFPLARQFGFMVGLSASIALGLSVVFWSQSKDYVPIYMDLSLQGASEVVEVLERSNTQYRMDNASGMIQVPADEVQRLRMQLAAEGLPSNEDNGFDILNDQPQLGLSGFMERARYDHALEQELAQTVSTIENVRSARVHLAVPKASGFIRRTGRPAASVLVNLYRGQELSKRQIAGITHLVAASVPEMLAEDVSIIDHEGRLISNDGSDSGLGAGLEQFDVARAVEQSYVDRILEILVPIAGPAGVRAQVNADLDFTSFESTSETYSPDRIVRSEQIEQEQNSSSQSNGGVPGTLSNQPPDNPDLNQETVRGARNSGDVSSTSRTVRNYELDKTISHERKAPGVLQRLTVAVVLDHRIGLNAEGERIKEAYSQLELDQMTSLVREAVGFDAERGDRVTLTNSAFAPAEEFEEVAPTSLLEAPWVWQGARTAVAFIICIILVFAVIRPAMRNSVRTSSTQSLPAPEGENSASTKGAKTGARNSSKANSDTAASSSISGSETDSAAGSADSQTAMLTNNSEASNLLIQQQEMPLYRHQLDAARDLVEQQPETVAHVVKHWVSKDE